LPTGARSLFHTTAPLLPDVFRFTASLFNDAVSTSGYVASNDRINNEYLIVMDTKGTGSHLFPESTVPAGFAWIE
jgi:hypothetical protein